MGARHILLLVLALSCQPGNSQLSGLLSSIENNPITNLVSGAIGTVQDTIVGDIVGAVVDETLQVGNAVSDLGTNIVQGVQDSPVGTILTDVSIAAQTLLNPVQELTEAILTYLGESPIGDIQDELSLLATQATGTTLTELSQTLNRLLPGFPNDAEVADGNTFDFIVVGGGSAGLVVANRLTEIFNVTVLVIEAGDATPVTAAIPGLFNLQYNSNSDYQFRPEDDGVNSGAQVGNQVLIHSGKMLGGSSCSNFLVYSRARSVTYEDWNVTGWDYDTALEYFKKAEDLNIPSIASSSTADVHGYDGPVKVSSNIDTAFDVTENIILDSFNELGYETVQDINSPDVRNGFARPQITVNKETNQRSCSSLDYLYPILDRPNLFIIKNSNVNKILFEGKKAIGVEVQRPGGEIQNLYVRNEVILSAGVFKSPQVLMLSGIGPKDILDSLNVTAVEYLPVGENHKDMAAALIYLSGQRAPLSATETLTTVLNLNTFPLPFVQGVFSLTEDVTRPDVVFLPLVIGSFSPLYYSACTVLFNLKSSFCNQAQVLANTQAEIVAIFVVRQNPDSAGRITIQSLDPLADPIIDQGYYINENDLEKNIEGIKIALSLRNATYYKEQGSIFNSYNICNEFEQDTEEFLRCYTRQSTGTLGFSFGSNRMSDGDDGVVDARLRVKGITGLRVVDASVFPSLATGLPLATTFALAEQASDYIKQDNGLSV